MYIRFEFTKEDSLEAPLAQYAKHLRFHKYYSLWDTYCACVQNVCLTIHCSPKSEMAGSGQWSNGEKVQVTDTRKFS